MRKDFRRRQSISYKIKFWFYRLTFRDVCTGARSILSFVIEFIMCALLFGLLFIAPAFLH